MAFPQTRLRRLRKTGVLRDLVRETELSPSRLVYPLFVEHGLDRRTPIEAMPGIDRLSINHAVEEAGEAHALGVPAVLLFGIPAAKDDEGSGAWDDEGVVQLAVRALKEAHPELVVVTDVCLCEYTSHGHCGRLRDGRHRRQRLLARAARPHRGVPGARGRRRRRAERHDGRARRLHPRRARRGRLLRHADRRLLGEVRLRLLRALPRGRGLDAGLRRPPRLPDGPGQRARGGARGDARRRGGRRRRDGQAGASLPRRDPRASGRPSSSPSPPTTSAASTPWSRRPPRPGTSTSAPSSSRRSPGSAAPAPTSIITYHAKDVASMASVKVRSRAGGSAVALDDLDRRLLNLMQGSFPLAARPYAAVARAAEIGEDEALARVSAAASTSGSSARSRRSTTPARWATRRCSSPPRWTPSTRTARREIINSHPGVSHNYLRDHEFNLWFTLAVEPDSALGLQGTLDVLQRLTGAESIRQLPTLKLFKIRMDLEMEKGTEALADRGGGGRAGGDRAPALRRGGHRGHPRHPGQAARRGRALRRAARSAWTCPSKPCSRTWRA